MLADGCDAAKRAATFRKDWRDLKADLQRWSRVERVSAGVLVAGMLAAVCAILPATLVLLGQT